MVRRFFKGLFYKTISSDVLGSLRGKLIDQYND